ncbi:hypothetical protein [Streptomyces sp. NPDC047046]|uniref:hypothetical protein n=1 Tax=Streptomyces sp. NPDC047046 TaxID=3155378 RepID=UPI0033EF0DFB
MTRPDAPDPGAPLGNTFYGPANFTTGSGSVMNVAYHEESRTPLEKIADELADVVHLQWHDEALRRRLLYPVPLPSRWKLTTRKVGGHAVGATAEKGWARFAPLPGMEAVTAKDLHRGGELDALHRVYGGMASGRLWLIGHAAAGKTSTAILLLLDALTYRRQAAGHRSLVPVPVLLTVKSWDQSQDAETWVVDRLAKSYTLFRGRTGRERVRSLLHNGHLSLFLDGLDEVDRRLRPRMLEELDRLPCRLLLLSRARETVTTSRKSRLVGAAYLELRSVAGADAAAYLREALGRPLPPAWEKLSRALVADGDKGPLAGAFGNPLTLTMLRDVYGEEGPVDELLDTARFPTPRAVTDHLLGHVVAAAYTPGPHHRHPRWSPETAERALRYFARQCARQGTTDFAWWHVPAWTESRARVVVVGVLSGLLEAGLAVALGVVHGRPVASVSWVVFMAVAVGLASALAHRAASASTSLPSAGWRDVFTPVGAGVGLLLGGLNGAVTALYDPAIAPWRHQTGMWSVAFGAMLALGRGGDLVQGTVLGIGLRDADVKARREAVPATTRTRSVTPREVWRHHSRLRMFLALAVSVAALGFIGSLPVRESAFDVFAYTLLGCAFPALLAGLVRNLAVCTVFGAIQLAVTERTPPRLLAFLEDARAQNLLRAQGPVYEFRHDWLLERLARDGDESGPRPPGPAPTGARA